MKRGPQPGARAGTDFLVKAQAAWGEAIPPEVVALAVEANNSSGGAAAKRIGYSPAVVSHLLANKYPEKYVPTVLTKIRGALMGETVGCPVLGEIGRDRCLSEQKRPFAATNSTRARLFHACRTCPNRQGGAS